MNRFVQFSKVGLPEVLQVFKEAIPEPQGAQVVVKNEAIGFNFIDTYFRKGIYPVALPFRGGSEGAGIVHSLGPDVPRSSGLSVGDKVCYLAGQAYADYTAVPSSMVAKLPKGISSEIAAASLLKGLTAQYLLQQLYVPARGDIVVFHAGAGGVGLIFLQWAHSLGIKVITTVSTPEKAQIARENGAWEVLLTTDDLAAEVKRLTNGQKVKVVYDSVGKDTFEASLDCLAPRGLLVSFGNASGQVDPFPLSLLSAKGSLFITRPTLAAYISDFPKQVAAFFDLVQSGTIKIHVNQTYKLEDVAQLHKDAENRRTSGSTVIVP